MVKRTDHVHNHKIDRFEDASYDVLLRKVLASSRPSLFLFQLRLTEGLLILVPRPKREQHRRHTYMIPNKFIVAFAGDLQKMSASGPRLQCKKNMQESIRFLITLGVWRTMRSAERGFAQ